MQKILFKYKGTMIKITGKLSEEFEHDVPLSTVREALDALNRHYDNKLHDYLFSEVYLVLKREGESVLINTSSLDEKLGAINTITFYTPFKGG
jgi:hypothetical protein